MLENVSMAMLPALVEVLAGTRMGFDGRSYRISERCF
jgi:hypothetical protein